MDRWDAVMYAIAVYVAVTSLVRLMANRRNELVEQVRQQIEDMQRRSKKVKKSKSRQSQDQEAA